MFFLVIDESVRHRAPRSAEDTEMDLAERLLVAETWLEWVRAELGREVDDLIAILAGQLSVEDGLCIGFTAAAFTAAVGRQLVADRVQPLLEVLDEVCAQLRYAQAEVAGVI